MVFNRLGFAAVVLISFLLIGRLWSQEAVDLERSAKSAEETTPEPSTTPEKSAKKEGSEKPTRGVEETMRPEEFRAAGLDKLSEDELQHLDAWLQGYRQSTQKKAAEQAQAKAEVEIKKATEKATEEANKTAVGRSHQQIAQACWNSFEPYVRKNPAPWLWMYKNWRYKPVKAGRPYP